MQLIRLSFFLVGLTLLSTAFVAAQEKRPDDLFIVKVDKKYGFIDRTGKIVIEPQWGGASDFSEGLAIVETYEGGYRQGYIDKTGKILETAQFNNLQEFSEGLAAVGVGMFGLHGSGDHKWGFIDKSGKLAIEVAFRETRGFSEGLAAVMNDQGKWGFIDKSGKLSIPFQFDDAFDFSEGLACVLTDGLFGFVDKSGKFVIPPRFAVPGRFTEGVAAVEIAKKDFKAWTYYGSYGSSDGQLVFIDKTGREVFKVANNVKRIDDFSEGLARVEVERRKNDFYTGFIDKTGKEVIRLPYYSGTGKFSEGMSLIEKNGRYGFIDKTGKIVIAPVYRWAEDFHNGLAEISTSKQIWDFKPYDNHFGFEPNLGYIDKTGKVIWKPIK